MSNDADSNRIAKNTILLYFRMFLTMGVSLYTSRIILNTLGVEDYGIYNVIGGVVIMFSFLNSSMSSATQRFLSFELGKNNYSQLGKVFSMSLNIHAIIAVAIFILTETIGLWFLNAKLVIPVERIEAANWVYQFSIFSFIVTIMSVPYNATIIAHERMKVFAYVSIIEVVLKLVIVFALVWFGFDKLKMYSILVFCVSALVWCLYKIYTKRNFSETTYKFFWEKSLYTTLMNYAGWNLYGNLASVMTGQGVNILLNLFFGPIVNAARGIAYQVNGAVNGFVSNFQMAMNPQIIKSYATNNREYMHQLIYQGAKYSFFLLYFLSLPILLETEIILKFWLKIVPEYAVVFTRLVIINLLIDCISGPLMTAAQASGKIKVYQVIVGGILLMILPFSYLFLKLDFPPQITLYISIVFSIIALVARLQIVCPLVNLSILEFSQYVLVPVLLVFIISAFFPMIIRLSIDKELIRFFAVCTVSIPSVVFSIYLVGIEKGEQNFIKGKLLLLIEEFYKLRMQINKH
jgi:O-antigen/teichoic acid export membrane protein